MKVIWSIANPSDIASYRSGLIIIDNNTHSDELIKKSLNKL